MSKIKMTILLLSVLLVSGLFFGIAMVSPQLTGLLVIIYPFFLFGIPILCIRLLGKQAWEYWWN